MAAFDDWTLKLTQFINCVERVEKDLGNARMMQLITSDGIVSPKRRL